MIEGLADPMVEQFQNPEAYDDVYEEDIDESVVKANPMTYSEDEDDYIDKQLDVDVLDDDEVENEDNDNDDNNPMIAQEEGFRGSQYQLDASQTLLLKCALFGMLFYILASPKSHSFTNQFIPSSLKIDRTLLHAVLFGLATFILYQFM